MMDSLKHGWRGSEFWLAAVVVLAGVTFAGLGHPWPGLTCASVASVGYGLSRGLSKASYAQRGGSQTRVV
jgi:hypothetical protein